MSLSTRSGEIVPFYAVELYRQALERARTQDAWILCIGEPDFPTPERVIAAAAAALRRGETHYTQPMGIPALRGAIAALYSERYGHQVSAERVAITVGASGALSILFGVITNPGDEILMTDPGYPANRAFISYCDATSKLIPVGEGERFQLTAEMVDAHWGPRTRAVMIASPSNPCGTCIPDAELRRIYDVVRQRGGTLIVDEIYHGLVYDGRTLPTAASLGDDVWVINSFSKYYCMTGWRLGWMIVPPAYLGAVERMQGQLFLCPPSPAQWAALAALEPESTAIYETQRAELQRRRDFLVPALREAGFGVECVPEGAFYVYANVSRYTTDSWEFAQRLVAEAGVAVTPGRDFGVHRAHEHVRVAFTLPVPRLVEAVEVMASFAAGVHR